MHNTIFSKIKINTPHKLVDILNRYSLLFHGLLACGICFVIEWVSRHSFTSAFFFMFDRSLVFLYNSLLVYATLMLVYLFRRRFLMRTLISVLWLFLGTINGCILLKRVSPFSYTDLKMVGDLFTMQSNYFSKTEAILVISGVAVVLVGLVVLAIKGPKYTGRQRRLVSLLSMAAMIFCIPMVTDAAVSGNVLADYFENLAQGYEDNGFIYSFSSSVVDRGMHQPRDYSEEAVAAAMDTVPQEPTTLNMEEAPNIICVLLESFVDPYEINFLSYSQDPVPNFHALYDQFTSGHLTVPVVGAGTANTEFEILTGMGMHYFGLGELPYKTILKTNSCESIASDLGKLGYGSHVVHNNGGNFYSRRNAFTQMGFDSFISKEMINIQEYTPLGTWPTDNCLIEEVRKSLDVTPGQPDFIYTITVQGHGSYPTEPVLEHPEIQVTGAASEEEGYAWEYYINMLHEVDKFIGDLTDMLAQRDEKTVVVMFGDHLPTMGLTEEDMATGSLFHTKYITWSNFEMEKSDRDLTSYQLMSYILDQLGIHEGTMMNYHQAHDFTYSEEYDTNMEMLQYDILYGDRYAYGGQDLYPASDLVMGVSDIAIRSMSLQGDVLEIYGENFTPWSRVFVNGEKVSTTVISGNHLQIKSSALAEGDNSILVNQMGSSDTVFRSSNELVYHVVPTENLSE